MNYIPEQPRQSSYPEIKRDGLLDIYVWTEHPCNFLPHCPHECMIKRCKPDDITGICTRQLDCWELDWMRVWGIGVWWRGYELYVCMSMRVWGMRVWRMGLWAVCRYKGWGNEGWEYELCVEVWVIMTLLRCWLAGWPNWAEGALRQIRKSPSGMLLSEAQCVHGWDLASTYSICCAYSDGQSL